MTAGKLIVVHDAEQTSLSVQLHQSGNVQSASPVQFDDPMSAEERSDLRWYLEDYLRLPVGIYPDRARRIEGKMAEWGGAMFDRLFGSGRGHDFYVLIKNAGLKNYNFEVHYQSAIARNFPWELLYDTQSKFYLAHQFASFTRCQKSS